MADPRYCFEEVCYEAITPVHVGSGQDIGVVDLPVIRERTTDHPFLPGSGIRGALRDRCEAQDRDLTQRLFGSDKEDEVSAGCVVVLDAHLVLFPVRAAPGVFRWLTCHYVLRRWRGLREYFVGDAGRVPVPQTEPEEGTYAGGSGDALYLEEYPFRRSKETAWSWPADLLGVLAGEVVLLSDVDFLHFVRHATLVRQRNRLSTAKTVLDGHLFSMEAVPAESRFVGFLGATGERVAANEGVEREEGGAGSPDVALSAAKASESLRGLLVQPAGGREAHVALGGDESVGQGVTRVVWTDGAPEPGETS